MDYLYTCRIYIDTSNVIGVDPAVEAANQADFETNYKAQTYEVNDLQLNTNFATVTWDYATMKDKIVSDGVSWGDVRLIIGDVFYDLNIVTSNTL